MEFFIGDFVEVIDKDAPDLFPKGPVRGYIKRLHKSKGWYWISLGDHPLSYACVPVRWDHITKVIKR